MLFTGMNFMAFYIDPTAITTSLVSASGIIIALGTSVGVLLSKVTTISATASTFMTKLARGFVNAFCVVEHAGKAVEPDITLKKKQ
ncbi:MAG: hypothetical protein E7666_03050 [Ruminococcaceae bacterium]|nr:hypothetical protein [Oscillospiraceae bacterium]